MLVMFTAKSLIILCHLTTGVQSAAVNVICELARKNPKNYLSLAPLFFKLMTSSTNNWMLIKIIKLVSIIKLLLMIEPRYNKGPLGTDKYVHFNNEDLLPEGSFPYIFTTTGVKNVIPYTEDFVRFVNWRTHHMWVGFVVDSVHCPEWYWFFSVALVFSFKNPTVPCSYLRLCCTG